MEFVLLCFGVFFLLGCVATLSVINSKLGAVIELLRQIAEHKG